MARGGGHIQANGNQTRGIPKKRRIFAKIQGHYLLDPGFGPRRKNGVNTYMTRWLKVHDAEFMVSHVPKELRDFSDITAKDGHGAEYQGERYVSFVQSKQGKAIGFGDEAQEAIENAADNAAAAKVIARVPDKEQWAHMEALATADLEALIENHITPEALKSSRIIETREETQNIFDRIEPTIKGETRIGIEDNPTVDHKESSGPDAYDYHTTTYHDAKLTGVVDGNAVGQSCPRFYDEDQDLEKVFVLHETLDDHGYYDTDIGFVSVHGAFASHTEADAYGVYLQKMRKSRPNRHYNDRDYDFVIEAVPNKL